MSYKKGSLKLFVLSLIIVLVEGSLFFSQSESYDIIIKNTRIVDGTGKPAFKGSLAIREEKIVTIGEVKGDAAMIIDGSGLVTCPGFIDPHSHADTTIMENPQAENLIMQGITTFVGGNCAMSPAPLKDLTFGQWLSNIEKKGISINYVPLVGHNNIRQLVMGEDYRRNATTEEIAKMKTYVQEAMESGAFGFSTFGDPAPSHFANVEEIIELAIVVQKYGGLYAPHTKHIQSQWPTDNPNEVSYGIYLGPPEDVWVGLYRGYVEVFEISRRANIPLHIAHISNAFRIPQPHPDFLEEAAAKATLWLIDKARAEGIDVTFDTIPSADSISTAQLLLRAFYSWRNTSLDWVKKIKEEEFAQRLKAKEFRERLRRVYDAGRLKFEMVHTKADPYWYDCFRILSCKNKEYLGKTIGEIATMKDVDPLETIFDLLVEDPETIWVQFLDRRGTETMNAVFLKHPYAMPCTDVSALSAQPKGEGKPAPIAYGLYPHYIGRYIRDKAIQSLEEALRKATSFPAQRFGIKDRGILKPNAYADIVVFDFERIKDEGDFLDPTRPPKGIEFVLVNGKVVYRDKTHTGEKPGKVLRKYSIKLE